MSRMNKSAVDKLKRAVVSGRGSGSTTKRKLLENLARSADMATACVEEALNHLGMRIVQDQKDQLWKVVGKTRAGSAA